jgi:riboflavin kinase/FMN adenylyltransferase
MTKKILLNDVIRDQNTVLTVGTFDGVHAGHKVLINSVLSIAEEKDARSVIVTFDPHPREIISPGDSGIKLLSTLDERRELLEDLGIDEMVVVPFDRDFSLLTSEEFVKEVIWEKIGVSHFIIGYDHQFGRNREGTIETVQRLGRELGFTAGIVSKQEVGNKTVSSTAIRNAIQREGNMKQAASFLERYYLLNGTVVHGDKRGHKIGYPTANIQTEHNNKVVPKNGVYAVWVRIEGEYHGAMLNIGVRPTFNGEETRIEAFIFDFEGDLYGKPIQVQFSERIRDEVAFSSVDELKGQLDEDQITAKRILKNHAPNIAKQSN